MRFMWFHSDKRKKIFFYLIENATLLWALLKKKLVYYYFCLCQFDEVASFIICTISKLIYVLFRKTETLMNYNKYVLNRCP